MSEHLLDVNITKRFGTLTVLDNVKFHVNENEFLVIVGPTGCGKTTLANLLCGLDQPQQGQVLLRGQKINPDVHNISYVFQESSCIPWYTMLEDATMGLVIKGQSQQQANARGREVIKLVGMEGFEDYYPRQISGGMKQRVAIARAYATNPDLLVMDEPFGHLDAQTRYLMQIEIMRIWQQERKTVVFITNNIEEAVYVASRILVLTKLPATIKAEHIIEFPHPRELTDADFLQIRALITQQCEVVE
ncbi:MAG: ABC transporter ATP-binding protein [Desulfovibrionaceae bacterium]|nr:ABC transporter ATP-binding protein [Desulfovibrionaceae bacterium]